MARRHILTEVME